MSETFPSPIFAAVTVQGTTTCEGPLDYTATSGIVVRAAQARAADVANALDFGADPTGVVDSALAFQMALATGRAVYAPGGTYLINSQVVVGANQTLYGDGRGVTTLNVTSTFSSTATSVILLTGTEFQAPTVRDFAITFQQPTNQTSRANFLTLANGGNLTTGIQYPPAILSAASGGSNRFRISNIGVSGAWDGFTLYSIGGAFLDDIEMGALNCGIRIDNMLDFSHLKSYHFWPFGLNIGTTFTDVFNDGNTFAARFGESGVVNGLAVEDFCSLIGRIYISNAGTWIHFGTLMCDEGATLEINGCNWVLIDKMYFTGIGLGVNTNSAITVYNTGFVQINNFFCGSTRVPVSLSQGILHISGSNIGSNGFPDQSVIVQTGGQLYVDTSILGVSDTAFGAWTVPIVQSLGGTIHFTGNTFSQRGPTSNTIPGLSITTDNATSSVMNNNFGNWSFTAPGTLGYYSYNSDNNIQGPIDTGNIFAGAVSGNTFVVNAAAGTDRNVLYQSSGSNRWAISTLNNAESGGNAGSDLAVANFNDSGTSIGNVLAITRSSGVVSVPILSVGTLAVTGVSTMTAAINGGNINGSNITASSNFFIGSVSGPSITQGAGVPAFTAPVGSLYLRTGGAVGSTLYVSRGGGTWNAVAAV